VTTVGSSVDTTTSSLPVSVTGPTTTVRVTRIGGGGNVGGVPLQTQPATTPTTPLVCHNSTNPACGPLEWSPWPAANVPMQITVQSIEHWTGPPPAGVTVHVHVLDPDTPLSAGSCFNEQIWGDGVITTGDGGDTPSSPCSQPREGTAWCQAHYPHYGPWTPPAPHPSSFSDAPEHGYAHAGTYTVRLIYASASDTFGCFDPYVETGSITLTVTVP
jgi:hypothetical protein